MWEAVAPVAGALPVFPHMVCSTCGAHVVDDLTDRLVVSGVDLFPGHRGRGGTAEFRTGPGRRR